MIVRLQCSDMLKSSGLVNSLLYTTLSLSNEVHFITLTTVVDYQIFWLSELRIEFTNDVVDNLFLLVLVTLQQ